MTELLSLFPFCTTSLVCILGVLCSSCSGEDVVDKLPQSAHVAKPQAETNNTTPAQPTGTQRMIRRLAAIAENTPPMSNAFMNQERLAYLRNRPIPADAGPQHKVRAELELANELLRAGFPKEAAEHFNAAIELIAHDPTQHPAGLLARVRSMLAVSYLRIGEQENCLDQHASQACLLPIQEAGAHRLQSGSRAALGVYAAILRDSPDDLMSRWLYNVAAMTVGEYPQGVPAEWLIPAEVFESDYDIGRFPDVAPQVGLAALSLAGGSSVEDFDGDGYLDVMVSSWGMHDQLRFFHNRRDGTFEDRTHEAGLTGLVGGLNIVHADYDNDGDVDVFVPRGAWMGKQGRHPNSLLRNNGQGFFEDVTDEAGLLSFHPTQTAAWGDYDKDGWLDLYIGNESSRGEFHPCQLYRNNGRGSDGRVTFTDVAQQAGVRAGGPVKGVVWGDYDNDGWLDLYVSRMRQPNLLFHNQGSDLSRPNQGQRFVEVGEKAGVTHPTDSFPTWFFDYDNDGWLDLFVGGYATNFIDARATEMVADYLGLPVRDVGSRLYRNNQDGTFDDVTATIGLDHAMLAMGANFGDLDNDGYLDLYIGTGAPDFRALVPNRMFRNAHGRRFQDVTSSGGFGHLQKGHGIAFADIDNDGDQDVFAVLGGAFSGDTYQNALFANPGHGNHWLTLRLEGVESNRSAIGTRLRLELDTPTGARQVFASVDTGGSFGASSLQQEIGLGAAKAVRALHITWPSGTRQVFQDLSIDQIVHIREGDVEPRVVGLERVIFPQQHGH